MTTTEQPNSAVESIRLANLSPIAKLFVAIVTTLMLFVCFWAVWIFYEAKGKPNPDHLPAYLQTNSDTTAAEPLPGELQQDLSEITADSSAVMAPQWDTTVAGQELPIDSASLKRIVRDAILAYQDSTDSANSEENFPRPQSRFRHNLGLAHTHVNGQTLLFFVMGFVFLFSSATKKVKTIVYWLFGVAILIHAIGLTGQGYYSIFDDLLAVSGLAILLLIAYMALRIYVDLAKKSMSTP